MTQLLIWLWTFLPRVGPLTDDVPINEGNYQEPEWFTPLMQFSDRYGVIVFPIVGLLVVGAIVLAILKSASHKTIPGPERMHVKKEVIHELRRQIHGMSLEQLARHVGQHREALRALLEEMIKDGMLKQQQNSKGAQVYKLPGM